MENVFVRGDVAVKSIGTVGVSHNRNINAAAAVYAESTNSATWPTEIGAITVDSVSFPCLVVYDAPNASIASTWLSDTGGAAVDVAYDYVKTGETLRKQFGNNGGARGIKRIDVLPIGGASRVIISAVAA